MPRTNGSGPPDAALILPAYNEERGLAATLRAVERIPIRIEVVVVDDGSQDATADVAEAAGVRLVRHASNRGKAEAIRTGISSTDARRIVVMDADATYPADAIAPMLELLADGHDYISGTRHTGRHNIPIVNRIGNRTLATGIRLLSGSSLSDPLTGMYAFRRDVLPAIKPEADGFAVETEIAFKAARAGLRTAEVPIEYGLREGDSKLRPLRDGWTIVRTLLRLALRPRKGRSARMPRDAS